MTTTVKKSFRELYLEKKAVPNPAQEWLAMLAKETGVGIAAVRQWAAGNKAPTDYRVCTKLTAVLGVDYDTLFPNQQ